MTRSLIFLAALAACAPSDDAQDDTDVEVAKTFPTTLGKKRPADVVRPAAYQDTLPAIVLLHGYGVSARVEDFVFQFTQRVETDHFLLVLPEGTTDDGGSQFWNATPECCNFGNSKVDDVAYLSGIAQELRDTYNVSSIAVVGHSNGGYMGYRLSCDTPDAIDRLVVVAGSGPLVAPTCASGSAPALLHIHGTSDDLISYEPGTVGGVETVGAVETVRRYAARAGCDAASTAIPGSADLTTRTAGAETTGLTYNNCPAPTALWTIEGGDHYYLEATATFRDDVTAFALGGPPTF